MEKNNIMIIVLLVIIIALLAGILVSLPNLTKTDETTDDVIVDETASDSDAQDTITVELDKFDTKVRKTAGEYTVEAEKWRGGSVGGFGVWLYKDGQLVNKDSYLSRVYFYMDGEWKWSEWGNGQGADYHKYPVSSGVEIKEIEVKF